MTKIQTPVKIEHDVLVRMPVSVNEILLHDVLVTAVEGGISHWAAVEACTMTEHPTEGEWYEHLEVRDRYESDSKRFNLNVETVLIGFRRLLEMNQHELAKAYTNERFQGRMLAAIVEQDAGNIDASDADDLVQLGLFGKLVYS